MTGDSPAKGPAGTGADALFAELARFEGPALLVTRNNLAFAERLAAGTPRLDWTVLTKDDLQGVGGQGLLDRLRSRNWEVLVIEDRAGDMPRRRDLYRGLLMAGRARRRWLVAGGDTDVRAERVHRVRSLGSLISSLVAEGLATARAIRWAQSFTKRLRGKPRPEPGPPPADNARVAVVRTDFWFGLKAGGSVSHAIGVLNGMRALGLEPRMWTTSIIPNVEGVDQTEILPPARPAAFEDAAVAGFNREFLRRAEPEARAFRPAVVYQRHSIFSLAGLALARRLGVPLVLEVNASEVWAKEAWSRLYLGNLARRMERTAFEKADRLVLISEELIPIVRDLGGDEARMVVNPNGVDVSRFDPAADGAPVRRAMDLAEDAVLCGFLGTFTRWHGVLFLAEQIPVLARENPKLAFLFLGDGDLRPEVERRLREAGLADRVRFTGLLAPGEVPSRLAACDILLSPHLPFEDGSPFFGSPTKLFEYLAAGRPVVASRLGQIGRIVRDGETGFLHDPGDGEGFRDGVRRLAADPARRREMGAAARADAETKYTWEANARRALDGLVRLPEDSRPT